MTVIDKTEKKIPFQTIPTGYTFYYNNEVYMVIDSRLTCGKNSICLNTGDMLTFHKDAEVMPCEVKLEIIKKGSFV